jgi:hypothetical protein
MEGNDQHQMQVVRRSSETKKDEMVREQINDEGWGRKAILILFFLTIGLSALFWFHAHFNTFFSDFFGPSSWTFSK